MLKRRTIFRAASQLVAAAILAVVLTASVAEARSIDVEINGEKARLKAYRSRDLDYVSLESLLRFLGASVAIERRTMTLHAELDGYHWQFWANSGMVGKDDDVLVLGDPILELGGELAAPTIEIGALLSRAADRRVEWLPEEQTLIIGGGRFNITGYGIEVRDNGILLEFGLTERLPHELGHSEGNWINLTLHNARLDPEKFRLRRRQGPVREMRAYQFDQSAQISIRMYRPFERYFATLDEDPTRLSLLIQDERAATRAAAEAAEPPETRRADGPIDLVVIDPGHGGDDPGTIGRRSDWAEKHATLSIAEFTLAYFESEDECRALLTRRDDELLSLSERARIANEAGADLFVSIHVNTSPDPNDAGSQTFFWAPAANDDGLAVASRENASDIAYRTVASDSDEALPTDVFGRAAEYQQFSTELAQLIQAELEEELDIPSRGVDQAELDVLAGLDMPAVVVECAFMSNPKEENLLRRESFHRRVAAAIYRGIMEYKRRYDPGG
ncbi:MAG TPA: N-acetylmuramoyl-L-alanine amidase [Acidobacteriota bacterium]|nr:N-acetylmuramoyl-L-alanine amidase [Acidobacteriota bacterium]